MDNDYLIPPPLLTQPEEEEEEDHGHAHGHGGGVSPNPNPSWVLLDRTAYISVDPLSSNSTTAVALMSSGSPIHISLCLSRPPLVSYLCAHFPGPVVGPTVGTAFGPAAGTPAVRCVGAPPVVLTTHANLALLRVTIPGAPDLNDDSSFDYFVYTARPHGGGGGGASSLHLLPRPPTAAGPRFRDTDVAILCCSAPGGGGATASPRYVIAALRTTAGSRFRFRLQPYDSDTGRWSMTPVTLPEPAERDRVLPIPNSASAIDIIFHDTNKVIHLGSTTVGWVDLWRGILFCDVLGENPLVLRDMPLPKPARSNRRSFGIGSASGQRDVTVVVEDQVKMMIKYVEMETRPGVVSVKSTHHSGSGSGSDDDSEEDEIDAAYYWKATVWSMPVPMSSWKDWRKECTVDVADTTVQNPAHCKVLLALPTRLSTDPQDDAAVSFRRLCTGFPTLGLGVDGNLAIYFLCKVDGLSPEGWVVQVGVRDNKLQSITKMDDRRNTIFRRYYCITDISKYLSRATGN